MPPITWAQTSCQTTTASSGHSSLLNPWVYPRPDYSLTSPCWVTPGTSHSQWVSFVSRFGPCPICPWLQASPFDCSNSWSWGIRSPFPSSLCWLACARCSLALGRNYAVECSHLCRLNAIWHGQCALRLLPLEMHHGLRLYGSNLASWVVLDGMHYGGQHLGSRFLNDLFLYGP